MNGGSQWYQRILRETDQYRYSLKKGEARKYKLDLLLRAAAKVDEFSPQCGECQALQPKITEMVRELGVIVQMPGQQAIKNHTRAVGKVVAHLQKGHKMVSKGHYIGVGIGIGMVIGGALGGWLGSMIDFPAIGTVVGIALGIAIGRYLDSKAQREGRVI